MLHSLRRFRKDEVAQERLKILLFYKRHGEEATKEAFGVDRKLIHVWRKRLKGADNQVDALVPHSTKPQRVRTMVTDPRIIRFIKRTRTEHPRIGKEKLKPLLDGYCKEQGIVSISESTIGKIIKRHKFFYQKAARVYHDPDSWWARQKYRRAKRVRVKHPTRRAEMGHFQADTACQFVQGIRRYIISAIDTRGKFSFSSCYPQLSSRNSLDFLKRLQWVYPLSIQSVQTDNGSEFLGEFEAWLKHKGIPQYFTYPRCPKINGCIERFNRTLKEEFVENNIAVIHDLPLFRQRLTEYLIFYNTQRPHKSLSLKSPIDYLIAERGMSKKIATCTPL
ncbi:MAG: integrase core domain-containing protein [bacterium]